MKFYFSFEKEKLIFMNFYWQFSSCEIIGKFFEIGEIIGKFFEIGEIIGKKMKENFPEKKRQKEIMTSRFMISKFEK